jgi:hypothetical protein
MAETPKRALPKDGEIPTLLEQLEKMFFVYLQNLSKSRTPSASATVDEEASGKLISSVHDELEIRFSKANNELLTRRDFDRVATCLKASGWTCSDNIGQSHLRVGIDGSNIRLELNGTKIINNYVQNEEFLSPELVGNHYLTEKRRVSTNQESDTVEEIQDISISDFNYRFSYKKEIQTKIDYDILNGSELDQKHAKLALLVARWKQQYKVYRYLRRVSFSHPTLPFKADLSIVRNSLFKPGTKFAMLPSKSIHDSQVFLSPERYEIEIELDSKRLLDSGKLPSPFEGAELQKQAAYLLRKTKGCIRDILCSLQDSHFLIGNSEMHAVRQSYDSLIRGTGLPTFIGPNCVTMQLTNLLPSDLVLRNEPNIRSQYTVTEKIDGTRKMLFFCVKPDTSTGEDEPDSKKPRVASTKTGKTVCCGYFIDTKGGISLSGIFAPIELDGTILDGEFVSRSPSSQSSAPVPVLYLAFDIYFFQKEMVTNRVFCRQEDCGFPQKHDDKLRREMTPSDFQALNKENQVVGQNTRLFLCKLAIDRSNIFMDGLSGGQKKSTSLIRCKRFAWGGDGDIFARAEEIWTSRHQMFDYEIDGLIFTPAYLPLYGEQDFSSSGEPAVSALIPTAGATFLPRRSRLWKHCLKWKPAAQNTVDFLVRFEDPPPEEYTADSSVELQLHCGSCGTMFETPWKQMMGMVPIVACDANDTSSATAGADYAAHQFSPLRQFDDPMPGLSIQKRQLDGKVYTTGSSTDDVREIIRNDSIVEFSYDTTQEPGHRWVPMRVRHDKMAEVRAGIRNFGNDRRVAEDNWNSIHQPVTTEMMFTGAVDTESESVMDLKYQFSYYENAEKRSSSKTLHLRAFHNKVKEFLLSLAWDKSTSVRKGANGGPATLLDLGVGVGGDLRKWKKFQYGFVLGIDLSFQNIHERDRGACARYLCESLDAREHRFHSPLVRQEFKKQRGQVAQTDVVYLTGDCSRNIRSTQKAFPDNVEENAASIIKAIFDPEKLTAEEIKALPPKVGPRTSLWGCAKSGFDVLSSQFAVHYFFKDKSTFNAFVTNLSECTAIGGLFLGTCLDGECIMNMFLGEKSQKAITVRSNDDSALLLQLTRNFKLPSSAAAEKAHGSSFLFPNTAACLGKEIYVQQESIGKVIPEYLVNLSFLEDALFHHGFEKVDQASKSFKDLFAELGSDARYGSSWKEMTPAEKDISFLNRTFAFRRVTKSFVAPSSETGDDRAGDFFSKSVHLRGNKKK